MVCDGSLDYSRTLALAAVIDTYCETSQGLRQSNGEIAIDPLADETIH